MKLFSSHCPARRITRSRLIAVAAGLGCVIPLYAMATTFTWQEGYKQVVPSSNIEPLSIDGLFGDQIGLYTGSLSFSTTDVDLRGNNGLKVAFSRTYVLDNPMIAPGWQIDLPHLQGVYSESKGWIRATPTGVEQGRCSSGKAAPPLATGSSVGNMGNIVSTWDPTEYWNGDFLQLPGQGSEEILKVVASGAKLPQDGVTYRWLTKSGWRFSCLTSAKNETGEAFLGVAPDGTRYTFDWFATEEEMELQRPAGQGPAPKKPAKHGDVTPTVSANKVDYLLRKRVRIFPSRVEDRFGNYVTYTYGPDGLTSIVSSDGRSIVVSRNGNALSAVTAGGRTWTYGTDANGLYRVTLPDGSYWQYDFSRLSSRLYNPTSKGDGTMPSQDAQCDNLPPPAPLDPAPYVGTVKHPSGAVGTFTVAPQRHGRSYVYRNCVGSYLPDSGTYYAYAYRPYVFDVVSLKTRVISGPGLPTQVWRYEYGPTNHSWSQNCASGACPGTKFVDVIDPDGVRSRHTFSNRWQLLEGKELSVEVFDLAGALMRRTDYVYKTDPTGQPYSATIGSEGYLRGDQAATKFDPISKVTTTQQGTNFNYEVVTYDDFARPTKVTKSSAPAP